MDLNHNNNDISNLLLLPKELHRKYHFYLNSIYNSNQNKKYERSFDVRLNGDPYNFRKEIKALIEVIEECQEWVAYKNQLDIKNFYKNQFGE